MKFYINETEVDFDTKSKTIKIGDRIISPSIRTYGDMKALYNETEDRLDEQGLYFMYRGVYLNDEDKKLFEENHMRYDVTILIPEIIGEEFNKTYGHYHPENPQGNKYEEIYEVLSGSALFLQQNDKEVNFTDAFFGDKVVMNENFGHVTINPSDEEILVMANIVNNDFASEYNEYKENDGANFYYKTSGFEMNPKYNNGLEISEKEDFFEGDDMYSQFLNYPEKFSFLN